MRNNTCTVCLREFEPRAGKLYCSNACKQKAFSDNKQLSEIKEENQRQATQNTKQIEFNFKEFQEYDLKYPNEIDFQLYCFLRRNLHGNPSLEDIHSYMNTLDKYWWESFYNDENSPARKKYKEFEAKFFSDDVLISFEKRVNETKSNNQNEK